MPNVRSGAQRLGEPGLARSIIAEAAPRSGHPYLVSKGFAAETAMVVPSHRVIDIARDYLVPDTTARRAIVVPVRSGRDVISVQLIWEDGSKKFLSGGEIAGGSHRIVSGAETSLCEGLATGFLSALRLPA